MKEDFTIYIYPSDSDVPAPQRVVLCADDYTQGLYHGRPWRVARSPRGKPYFPDVPQVHFSISHSGAYWLCAFGAQPVGIDLQIHQAGRLAQIARRFFNEEEERYLAKDDYREFFSVWTAKESYVKFTGKGIGDGFGDFRVADAAGLKTQLDDARLCRLPFLRDYSLCLCAAQVGVVRMVYQE